MKIHTRLFCLLLISPALIAGAYDCTETGKCGLPGDGAYPNLVLGTVVDIATESEARTAAGQDCYDNILPTTPDYRFVINGSEVSDQETGLIWQRCILGRSGEDCAQGQDESFTWEEALQAAEDERTNTGLGWRLPNLKELLSIAELKCKGPAANSRVFPNTPTSSLWTATPIDSSIDARTVNFATGGIGKGRKTTGKRARLVRDAK